MQQKKRLHLSFIHYIITFFLMFFFRFIPPIGGLSEVGMQVVGVWIGVLYGWVTLSISWPSILGVVALGLTDYMPMGDLLMVAFGSQTMVMILALLLLAAFVQQADLTNLIVDFLLTRKCTKGRPYMTLYLFLMAGFLAAVLSQCVAVLVIFLELFRLMLKMTELKPYTPAIPTFLVGMVFSFVIGDIALPFKGCAILGIGAYDSISDGTMNMMQYTAYVLPMCLILIVAYVLFCKFILRVDLSGLASYVHHPSSENQLTLKKKVSLIGVLVALVLLLVPSVLPGTWEFTAVINGMGLGGLALLIVGLLMVIKLDGESLMDFDALAKYFPWNVFFILAILLPLSDAISSDAVGLNEILSDLITPLLSSLPPVAVILAMVVISGVVTNFANNMVICTIFVTMICFMEDILPFDPAMLSCLAIIASNLSMFFPAANPMNAIVFSQKDIVTFRAELTHGLASFAFLCVVTTVVGYLYGLVIF